MKKWIAALAVLLAVGIYMIWPKASIEKPVVVSAQMNETNKTITISYITTKKDETRLEEAVIDGRGFYPAGTTRETIETKSLLDQDGYQLREDVIRLTEEELDYFEKMSWRAPSATITYSDYEPVETTLIVLKEDEAAEGVMDQQGIRYAFTAPEPMSITTIGHYDSAASLGYSYKGQELPSSIELEEGETVELNFDGPYQLASDDKLLVDIETMDGKHHTRHLAETMEVPEGYLKRVVAENP